MQIGDLIMIILILKIVCLFLSVWMTLIQVTSILIKDKNIPPLNFILQSVGITGFVMLQFLI